MAQVTIADIAEAAGLSTSSVSRILRGGQGHVYPAPTVERVHDLARSMGYRPNSAARVLSRGSQTLIGMSVHFTEHPYLNRFLVAVHQELLHHGYDPVLLDANHLSSENTAQPFPPPHTLAGLISMGIDLQETWPKHYASLAQHIPIVAVQPVSKEAASHVDVIQVDCRAAYDKTISYLTHLGHRHIAFLGVVENQFASDHSKLEGFVSALESRGLPAQYLIPWLIGSSKPAPSEAGPKGTADFIYMTESREAVAGVVNTLTSFPEKITALICASDEVALVLQSYLQCQGWSLPRDLSIIGYDGISLGEHVFPSLTTIAPNYARLAHQAVETLIHQIKSGDWKSGQEPRQIFVEPHLLVRESSGPPASA